MRRVLRRKAFKSRTSLCAPKARCKPRNAKALFTPRALAAAARGTKSRAVLVPSAFARSKKIPPTLSTKNALRPLRVLRSRF